MRLCCRAHNQYQAERTFGPWFMAHKRADARTRRAQRRPLEPHDPRDEVIARLGAALGDLMPGAPIEELVGIAVSAFRPERELTCTQSPSPPPDAESPELH